MRDNPVSFKSGSARIACAVLDWYDQNARELPWRVPPSQSVAGVRPDPYRVWLSEIMLQQTTVATVRAYYQRFIELWPDVHALAGAQDARVMGEWAGLGYYARARNLLKCARVLSSDLGGHFPRARAELLKLPGIGPYTSAAIAAIAFGERAAVLDGNIERVLSRLFDCHVPLPKSKPILARYAARLTPRARPGDYAQAMMDLGATVCTPKSPACGRCPLRNPCRARCAGTTAELPQKARVKAKPLRHGAAYIARRADGALLLERRPGRGLLGGMLGWPTTTWSEAPDPAPPFRANWREIGEVRHTFTHFHLILTVFSAAASPSTKPDRGNFTPASHFRPTDLPTVMRKAYDLWRK